MPVIHNPEGLIKFRDELFQRQRNAAEKGQIRVLVGMGSCGIAFGAQDTLEAIRDAVKKEHLVNVDVAVTGCIGLCEHEPIVQIAVPGQSPVIYGKVTPDIALRIIQDHVKNGEVLRQNLVSV